MARNRDPFTLALQTLRQSALEGAFGPDRPIIILEEAQRLRLSTTPIREALAWLGGEGMIERAPNGGYMGLRQDAASVSGRYRLRGILLATAVSDTSPLFVDLDRAASEPVSALFAKLVRLSGDEVLWRGYERVARQLAWLEKAETEVVGRHDDLVKSIWAAVLDGGSESLSAALDDFHQALTKATSAILIVARQGPLAYEAAVSS